MEANNRYEFSSPVCYADNTNLRKEFQETQDRVIDHPDQGNGEGENPEN